MASKLGLLKTTLLKAAFWQSGMANLKLVKKGFDFYSSDVVTVNWGDTSYLKNKAYTLVANEEKSYSPIKTKSILAIQQLPTLYHVFQLWVSLALKKGIIKFVLIIV